MNRRYLGLFILLIALFAGGLYGQEKEKKDRRIGRSKKLKVPISGGERFDIILGRGLLIPRFLEDTTDLEVSYDPSRSGSFFLGVGYSFPFGSVFAIKLEPRVVFEKLIYRQLENKEFPTLGNATYIAEKHRFTYIDLPLGFKFNLVRNKKEKLQLFMEVGGSFGYRVGRAYKRRYKTEVDGRNVNVTEKIPYFPGVNPFRYGAYLRIGSKWVALDVYYRISSLFDNNAIYEHPDPSIGSQPFPRFSPLEIGLVVIL